VRTATGPWTKPYGLPLAYRASGKGGWRFRRLAGLVPRLPSFRPHLADSLSGKSLEDHPDVGRDLLRVAAIIYTRP